MKKFYILLIALLAVIAVLTSCGGTSDDGSNSDDGGNGGNSGNGGNGGIVEMCPMDKHQMGPWEVVKEATCTENGQNIRSCTICGDLYQETQTIVNKTNHKYVDYVCTLCGKSINPIEVNFTLSDDGTYYILSSVESMDTKEYTIPESYKGLPVKEIGKQAFHLCRQLETVTVPNTIEKIGEGAFLKCYNIKKIVLPFVGMDKTTTNSLFGYIFGAPMDGKDEGLRPIIQVIGEDVRTYYIPPTLVDVTINGGTLDESCFMNCVDIRRVTYNGEGESVGDRAFDNCQMLDQITLPLSVFEYGDRAFQNCYELDTFPLYEGIETIGDYCFAGCINTDYLAIPSSLSSLGEGAFSECDAIKSVIVPSNVEDLPEYLFSGCSALETVTLEESTSNSYKIETIGRYCFQGCELLTTVNLPSTIRAIRKAAFLDCVKLTTVNIPKNIEKLEDNLFQNCSSLVTIDIPNGIEIICKEAFNGCSALETVKMPSSLKEIEENAFKDCSSLVNFEINPANANFKSVDGHILSGSGTRLILVAPGFKDDTLTIPDKITVIEAGAFDNALSIQNVIFPSSLTDIDDGVFREHPSIKSITIDANMKKIGKLAFAMCPKLESVNIKGVGVIDENAFAQCPLLKSVVLDGIETISPSAFHLNESLLEVSLSNIGLIGENAFAECKKLKNLTIGENVKIIGLEAFAYCESVESLEIGAGAESIGDFAFSYCKKIQSVTIADGLLKIGEASFEGCESLVEVSLPATLIDINAYAFKLCNALTTFKIDFKNPKYGVTKGCYLVENDMEAGERTLIIVAPGMITEEMVLPNNITTIGKYVFRHATQLKKVTLPDTLKVIEREAFFDSGLTEIDLKNVEIIGEYALGQTKLTSLTVTPSVKEIGRYAFQYCYDLREIYIRSTVETVGFGIFHDIGTDKEGVPGTPLEVYLEFADEDSIPDGWNSSWLKASSTNIHYGYVFTDNTQEPDVTE
ncbi:MAG: leucine-rich repeat protein [Clostridia bacterium]|nr:leucine-rich repeat protein [Clostridia bacterium]